MFNRAFFVAVVAGALAGGAYASCVNSCSGHGYCGNHDRCTCYASWEGTDCSLRSCPKGIAFADGANSANTHDYAVCSGKGVCDHATGDCVCSAGYTGYACARTVCPNDCSGHGRCMDVSSISDSDYQSWDGASNRGCVCDGYYTGADCSMRQCPRGDDPLTVEVECSGTSSGNQEAEVQEVTVYANKMLSGEMTLTYNDAYGQSWTTNPIEVGGDNKYDVRVDATTTAQCGLNYASADVMGSTSGDVATSFVGTKFNGGSSTGCSTNTAAQFDTLVSKNEALRNVVVSKSNDVSSGAKYEVSIGDLNFQRPSAGEIGAVSLASGATAGVTGTVHSLGDHSRAIQDALQSLPYNVIPSVTVSKVAVDVAGSDDVSASTTSGNMFKQKYRVTFSDAANSGDQEMLTCNAAGCNEDGCAPRYEGVVHERHLTTKSGSRPLDSNTGVTDARSTIVATGQGSFVLGHWHLQQDASGPTSPVIRTTDTPFTFTAGTYTLTWDYGSGNTDSASFAYNADAATIQTALRTITGWEGVTVTCNCYGSGASATCTSSTLALSSRSCTVTYAVGYDDGGKLPTMTYSNIQTDGNQDEATNARRNTVSGNDLSIAGEIGTLSTGATPAHFEPEDKGRWVYFECSGDATYTGYYEIVEADVNTGSAHEVTAVYLHMPGKADGTNLCTGTTIWKVTPLMPKFPSFSNTIALHDSTFTIQWAGSNSEYSPDTAGTDQPVQIGYKFGAGPQGSPASIKHSDTCSTIMTALNDKTAWPFGTSYCDCERTTTPKAPYIVEVNIRCPGWVAYDLCLRHVSADGGAEMPDATSTGAWPRGFHNRYANPRRMEHLFAVGDTVTVAAGGSNLNRQFTIQSYVSDNLFGDGRYGTHPIRVTSATSDYGDNIMYAKVTPAPVSDIAATHLVARGQNSTVFTRVIEDASTSTQEVAKLYIHDNPGPAQAARSENMVGTFQLSYDGEATRAIQTTATGADVMEFLAELSTLERVPAVTAAHETIDNVLTDQWAWVTCTPSASEYCARKVFTFTFDGQLGDMEKLKFVYTGANNDANLIISSASAALASPDKALPAVYFEYTSSGSTLMDYIVEGYVAGKAGNKVPAGTHDEVAMDVPVGATINISSSEDITFYLVDSAGSLAVNTAEAATCATAAADGPQLTFEYQGAFAALAFCSAATTYATVPQIQAAVRTLAGLETTTVVCRGDAAVAAANWASSDATVDTDFNSQFPSVAAYRAFAACTFTLPLGADGGAFFIHPTQHAGSNGWGADTAQTFVHRARNNNGRSFTVTKAYENKVSDLRTMARVSAGAQTAAYTAHAVYGDVTDLLTAGGGAACSSGGTPGIYYDVSIGTTASPVTGEVGAKATVEISCAAGSADCSSTYVSSVIITGYNTLMSPGVTYDLGAVLNTAAYGSCAGSKTLTLNTARHALAASLHTNTRKNQMSAFGTGGTPPACANNINMVIPYLEFKNLGTGPIEAVTPLAHVKCESGLFTVVANAAPGLVASTAADNEMNIQTGGVTDAITAVFDDADRPETGGTPTIAAVDDLLSQTVNVFSFDCTSDNRFNVDPLFDQSYNGMDKILLMGGRDPISDYYGYSQSARDYTFFSTGGANEAIYSSAFNYGRTQDGTSSNANDLTAAKLSKCSIATVENKDTGVTAGGASGDSGDERYEVAQPHAYIARGKDTLWLTPTPDAMTGKKIHMTVTTPASGCSVTEVTKGSHESTVCSGRGNCDYATGTCNCDAGYTLEACSEQTVLV